MSGKAVRFVNLLLAAFALLLAGRLTVSAEEFRTPETSVVHADWRAAQNQFRVELAAAPSLAADFSFAPQHRVSGFDSRVVPAWVALNAATTPIFTGIARSAVPVLLPFDTTAFLQTRQNGSEKAIPVSRYQADFRSVDFFDAGPAGYDAVFSLEPGAGDGLPSRIFAKPVEVQISGSLLIYDIADPAGGKGEPVKSLAAQYPDLRRFIREGYVRYAFTRFGVPYVVSIQCLDSAPRPRRLACREAYPIAERFLKALHVAGGRPLRPRQDTASLVTERPSERSADFTYRPVGDLLEGSGFHRQSGRTDFNAYSQIRFPLNAPAFLHSQSFGKHRPADKSDSPSGGYPWRDSFCEARSFNVGQCATGHGHQGQDIRPAPCPADTPASVCDPRQRPIFAVRDGVVLRSLRQQAATLQINTTTEHIRFRYMHMNPSTMDADRLLNGREVAEGEQIGVVSNYLDHPNGTSRHLHFDVQVFTRDGWIWVNPYVTLIAAYERLIHGRGREIGPQIAASPVAHALPEDVIKPDMQEGGSEN
ncbi:M23 family metallopeptidase [Bradyrhizobium sp. Tv2a-2]|uniref:M23 family metallopeptidase n=1 Tax=Bradyrhizobium sp. Tv2a-2 TaxID=113395 RepID=UPI0004657482|nr:M23 family metallopeptidase [Bradyrhizobium sp. Tv2a-2]